MSQSLGKLGVIRVSATTVIQLKSYRLNREGATTDASVIGDEWDRNTATTKKWDVSFEDWFDPNDPGQAALSLNAAVTVTLYPQGLTASNTYFSGRAILTGINTTGERSGLVSDALSMLGDGALTTLTVA